MMTTELVLVGVFVAIALLIAGPYWLFVGRSEAASRESLQRRVRTGGAPTEAARLDVLRSVERLSSIRLLESALGRSGTLSTALSRTIAQSGLRITVGQLVLGSGCLALGVNLAVVQYTQMLALGVAAGLLAAFLPYGLVRYVRSRRLSKFEEQFPEAIDLIARTLRAGHAFPTGLRLASEELPQPVAAEFKILHDQQNYGLPMPDALKQFAQRMPIIDARFFVTAVLTQREAGGNLAEVLDNLSSVIRERFKIKRQLRVITAHGRLTGTLLTALPIALAFMLAIRVPGHFEVLWEDPFGRQLIYTAIGLQIVGGLLIRKLTNIEY